MAKAQSLAAQAGALTAGLKMPAIFTAPTEQVKSRFMAPYITFAHPKRADEWSKIQNQFGGQILEGEMYLMRPQGIVKLDPAKMGWITHKQYWAQADAAGNILQASWQETLPKEHIEAVVLLYFDNEVVPANVCFRTTKCPAAATLSGALVDAAKPEWLEKSPEHKETAVLAQPMCRFYGIVGLGPTRTSKKTGLPYRPTTCVIKPTGPAEWRLLKKFEEDEASQKLLQDAADRFQSRIAEITSKVKS